MLRELRPEMEVETTASETAIPLGMASLSISVCSALND